MKKFYIILILLVFFLQFSFLPLLSWKILIPNILLITVIAVGIKKNFYENLGWLLFAGVLFEIFSVSCWGLNLLFFILAGIFAWFFYNILLNKEKIFLVEIFFWIVIKIYWDLSLFLVEILANFINHREDSLLNPFHFPENYFTESVVFVLSGFLIFRAVNFLESKIKSIF